jgi:hypothetical protein
VAGGCRIALAGYLVDAGRIGDAVALFRISAP